MEDGLYATIKGGYHFIAGSITMIKNKIKKTNPDARILDTSFASAKDLEVNNNDLL